MQHGTADADERCAAHGRAKKSGCRRMARGRGAGDEEKRQPQLLVAGKTQAVDGIMERKAVQYGMPQSGVEAKRREADVRHDRI
jgi:hypothetical protein